MSKRDLAVLVSHRMPDERLRIAHRDEWLEAIDRAYQHGAVSRRQWVGLRILYLFSGGKP